MSRDLSNFCATIAPSMDLRAGVSLALKGHSDPSPGFPTPEFEDELLGDRKRSQRRPTPEPEDGPRSGRGGPQQAPPLSDFHWQAGYGAFSVGYRETEGVAAYVAAQEHHYEAEGFRDGCAGCSGGMVSSGMSATPGSNRGRDGSSIPSGSGEPRPANPGQEAPGWGPAALAGRERRREPSAGHRQGIGRASAGATKRGLESGYGSRAVCQQMACFRSLQAIQLVTDSGVCSHC